MDPALSLECFAAISAELDAGTPREKVLAREGILPDMWTAVQEAWLSKLAVEVSVNRFDLTNRYHAAFLKRRQEIVENTQIGASETVMRASAASASARPRIEAGPPEPTTALPSPPAPRDAASPRAPIALPSFLVAAAAEQTRSAAAMPPTSVVPNVVKASAVAPAMLSERMQVPNPAGGDRPFTTAASASPAAAPVTPPADPRETPPRELTELHAITAGGRRIRGSTLALEPEAADPRRALQVEAEPDATGTLGGDLPFRKPTPASTTVGATVVGAISRFHSPLPFREGPTNKASGDDRPSAPAPMGGLPFQPAPAAPTTHVEPRLTLEQVAALATEIALNPNAVAQVRARYQLTEADHIAESAAWQRRFAGNPGVYARYTSLCQTYRAWLARPKR